MNIHTYMQSPQLKELLKDIFSVVGSVPTRHLVEPPIRRMAGWQCQL